jgi:tetratricopeptide (TPR) repeat protein
MRQTAQIANEAIQAALECKWDLALSLNNLILGSSPKDLCALNRLARAYMELGNVDAALQTYQLVLEIDPYNVVAAKNTKRLVQVKTARQGRSFTQVRKSADVILNFIEEPGRTKIVQLVRTASPDMLFALRVGERVELINKSRGIHVYSIENSYIGRLPDDLAHHLSLLMSYGNRYEAFLKHVTHNKVLVFLRENYRNESVMSHPSFPAQTNQNYFVPEIER